MAEAEYMTTLRELNSLTADKMKLILRNMNDTIGCRLKLSGLKADIQLRIKDEIIRAHRSDPVKFNAIKVLVTDCFLGRYTSNHATSSSPAGYAGHAGRPQLGQDPYASSSSYANPNYARFNDATTNPYAHLPPPRFNPNGAGSSALPAPVPAAAVGGGADGNDVPIRFRTSPFYRVEKSLSGITTLMRAAQGDRKSTVTQFALTENQRDLLTKAKASPTAPQYQVRLFCTHEEFYNPARSINSQQPAPIDYPSTCEIKLNGFSFTFSKGIKKKAGSAPPVDLSAADRGNGDKTKTLSLAPGVLNKVEVIYVNTDKKYYVVVFLVEVTNIKTVVERIRVGKRRSKGDVIQTIIRMNADPDVEATAMGLKLTDPLTFARIKIPIRSSSCNHIACFDATVFFMMNEQTPAWACPICSKTLRVEDITVDGYFEDILNTCPSSVESVDVEPDGTWRSDDDKWGTGQPKKATSKSATATREPTPVDKGKAKAPNQESLTLDSDDDEPLMNGNGNGGESKPHLNNLSIGLSSASPAPPVKRVEVIDLTLSDSDDEYEMPAGNAFSAAFRKEAEALKARNAIFAQVAIDAEANRKRRREEDEEEQRRFNQTGTNGWPRQ